MVRWFYGAGIAFLLAISSGHALAQDQWLEFRSEFAGFSVLLPQPPRISAWQIEKSNATQSMWMVERGALGYLVSLVQLEAGKGRRNPDHAYFQEMARNYSQGSGTTLRTTKPATFAGHPGMEFVSDIGSSSHQGTVFAKDDQVWMVIYVGPRSQENEPNRFRSSFRLTK